MEELHYVKLDPIIERALIAKREGDMETYEQCKLEYKQNMDLYKQIIHDRHNVGNPDPPCDSLVKQ